MVKELVFYETERGKLPFQKWISGIKDIKVRALIQARLDRLMVGHYGDCKPLQEGVFELRIPYGPGYRVYYGEVKSEFVIVLLLGGKKRTQERDIKKALRHWESFKKRYDYA